MRLLRTGPHPDRLAAAVIAGGCRDCPAGPGEWCDPLYPVYAEQVRMNRDPPLFVHGSRLADAIAAGRISRRAVTAKFGGGELPDALTTQRR